MKPSAQPCWNEIGTDDLLASGIVLTAMIVQLMEEIERESGEVSARDAATRPTPEAITANASQAAAAMYEALAAKIVEEASAQPSNGGRVR